MGTASTKSDSRMRGNQKPAKAAVEAAVPSSAINEISERTWYVAGILILLVAAFFRL